MHLFFDPQFTSNGNTLNSEESKHCVRVLRHTVGDEISILNGNGFVFIAQITEANAKGCKVAILEEREESPRPFSIHVAVAPTKNIDRLEWFLEKSTEVGIEEVTPIICDHSERKIIKPERLEKIITSATKQSLKAYKPTLHSLCKFNEFIERYKNVENKYIAHCYTSQKKLLKEVYALKKNALILIGPEGDFSEKEVKWAIENGFTEISLGNTRLRTETAALMACATINIINLVD